MMTRLKQWLYPQVKSPDLSFAFPDFITVVCESFPMSDSVKNLGVTLDCHLTMKTHVSNLVRSANFELCHISSIRHLLSIDATKTVVSAFVLLLLDYCNTLLFDCPQYLLNKLQTVQNNAAHLILRVSKMDHTSPHLASLHWLPIDLWMQYKLSFLRYNCLNSTASDYLTELLKIYKPTHQLHSSSDTSILCIPTVCTHSFSQRSFSYAAQAVWDTLPYEIRSSNTILSFTSSLKTDLFQQSYWLWGGGGRGLGKVRERELMDGLLQSVQVGFFHLFCFM